jgi:hypothetical protein
LRKTSRREKALLGLLAVTAVGVLAWGLGGPDGRPAVLGRSRPEPPLPPVPRIALARVDAAGPRGEAGRRDIFAFGAAPAREAAEAPVTPDFPPPGGGAPGVPEAGGDALPAVPPAPSLPPLNLRYIGSVESRSGIKVAVLLTDRQEVLTGQAGQVVANRYRIARIGLESVDLEDVGSGQSRRLPSRGTEPGAPQPRARSRAAKSRTERATTGLSSRSATRFGRAMRPFSVSATSQTAWSDPVAPTYAAASHSSR